MSSIKKSALALAVSVALSGTALAQETKVAIGISGWTGFAPLTLGPAERPVHTPGLGFCARPASRADGSTAPALGADGQALLHELGLDATELQALQASGVLRLPAQPRVAGCAA